MNFYTLLGIAVALAMDALTVTIGVCLSGRREPDHNKVLRLAFFFGLFQFLMPLLGWYAGNQFIDSFKEISHWIGFGILFIIGTKMITDVFREDRETLRRRDPSKGLSLVILSIGTSIDALAIGLSFAAFEQDILFPAVLIGIITMGLCFVGGLIAPMIGRRIGKVADIIGGLLLIGIGFILLLEHI